MEGTTRKKDTYIWEKILLMKMTLCYQWWKSEKYAMTDFLSGHDKIRDGDTAESDTGMEIQLKRDYDMTGATRSKSTWTAVLDLGVRRKGSFLNNACAHSSNFLTDSSLSVQGRWHVNETCCKLSQNIFVISVYGMFIHFPFQINRFSNILPLFNKLLLQEWKANLVLPAWC